MLRVSSQTDKKKKKRGEGLGIVVACSERLPAFGIRGHALIPL